VLKGGRGDEPIRCVEADAFQLAVSYENFENFENAPAFRNRFGDWQDAASKPRAQLILKPLTQPGAAVRLRMNSDAFADLAYGNDADVHQLKHQARIAEEVLKTANADRDRLQELDLEEAKAKALIRTAADQLRGDRPRNVIASTTYEPQ